MTHRIRVLATVVAVAGLFGPGCGTPSTPVDAGTEGTADAGAVDAGTVDAGSIDAGSIDAGGADAGLTCQGSTGCTSNIDCEVPGDGCVSYVCGESGCCEMQNQPLGMACTTPSGSGVCNGNGACVECLKDSECKATGTTCATAKCEQNACITTYADKGTTCTESGGAVCNGAGMCIAQHCMDGIQDSDETDKDCGGSSCRPCSNQQHCSAGADCSSGHCQAGTPGTCVECESASDCGIQPTDCLSPTCNQGTCGVVLQSQGQPVAADPKPGDCQKAVCDGNGGMTTANDYNDAPSVSPSACLLSPTCGGSPAFPNYTAAPAGTDCTSDGKPGKHVCADPNDPIAAGICVACNTGADCPAGTNECAAANCNNHVCGFASRPFGSPVLHGQTQGDCQVLVCNGNSGITSVDDVNDLPTSPSACLTNPTCGGHDPSFPTFGIAPTGTNCAADGTPPNHVCADASDPNLGGTCVECNVSGDCGGGGRVCVDNACLLP